MLLASGNKSEIGSSPGEEHLCAHRNPVGAQYGQSVDGVRFKAGDGGVSDMDPDHLRHWETSGHHYFQVKDSGSQWQVADESRLEYEG